MSVPKILIHVCCAPCFIAPWIDLKNKGLDITGFWYNPNIHPYTEYKARLGALKDFTEAESIPMVYRDDYALESFLSMALRSELGRCFGCYELRIKETAKSAAEMGFDAFSTTLLYSKYQNHEQMVKIAKSAAQEYGIEFYYQDFREFWQEGIQLSKERQMYRQKYCGCVFSERDRYMKVKTQ